MLALYIASFFLYIFGLLNLFGAQPEYFPKHLIYGILGLSVFLFFKKVGLDFFRLNAKLFYWIFVALLILTFIVGFEAKGSKRWIDLWVFNFQASEFFKLFFIVFLADYLSKRRSMVSMLPFYLKSLLYFLLPAIIIFKQPDLSTAIIFGFIFLTLSMFSSIPKKFFIYTILIGLLVLPLSTFFLASHQRTRIQSFFNPHIDQQGTSYNMTQAIISVGSGGFLGRGLGLGTQSQLYFLPENHTDFAFSSLIEQFGFIGGFTVIVLYAVIASVLVKKMIDNYYKKDEAGRFKFFFILGFLAFFVFQIFINMGMNLGVLPIAGITLPLISYGGSSLITWMIGLAMLSEVI